jgi:8-oxo-dGTP pyrophosphatase MutT (NUDIX family)
LGGKGLRELVRWARMLDRGPLEALLRTYLPQDGEERGHLDRMQTLLRAPGNPLERSHFVPGHFTASAFVLSPDRALLLLIHHQKLDRWLQPGGHIEANDPHVLGAARRELDEEAGLSDLALEIEGIFDLDVHPIPPRGAEPQHEHFDVRFLFRARSLALRAGSEVRAARWAALREVDEMTSDRSVRRAVHKLLRREAALQASAAGGS